MRIWKFTLAEALIVTCGGLLVIDSFLPWFRLCYEFLGVGGCGSHNGWNNFFSLLGILIAVAMAAQVAVSRLTTVTLPTPGPLTWGQVHLFAGIGVLALIVLQFAAGDSGVPRSFGVFIGLVLAAGIAAGGFLRSREAEAVPATGPAVHGG